MGFELGAILSIKANRSLQRKQSAFYTPEPGYTGAQLLIDKLSVDEERMQKIARRSDSVEVLFYGLVLIVTICLVYHFWG